MWTQGQIQPAPLLNNVNTQNQHQEVNELLNSYGRIYDNNSAECLFKWPVFIETSNVR